jgi:hypothetical protein
MKGYSLRDPESGNLHLGGPWEISLAEFHFHGVFLNDIYFIY